MAKYIYRDRSTWTFTDDPKDMRCADGAFLLGRELTKGEVAALIVEQEVEDAAKEVSRAEERYRAAQERLRIEKLKAQGAQSDGR